MGILFGWCLSDLVIRNKILVAIEAVCAVIFKSVSVEQVSASSIKGSIVSDCVCRMEIKKSTYVP